jgi:hypothetical protein
MMRLILLLTVRKRVKKDLISSKRSKLAVRASGTGYSYERFLHMTNPLHLPLMKNSLSQITLLLSPPLNYK